MVGLKLNHVSKRGHKNTIVEAEWMDKQDLYLVQLVLRNSVVCFVAILPYNSRGFIKNNTLVDNTAIWV